MIIDELRARRRELLEWKKDQLELLAKGEADDMAIFLLNEELQEVNSQIRALAPQKHIKTAKRIPTGTKDWALDRQQFLEWQLADQEADSESGGDWAQKCRAADQALASLKDRQRQVLELHIAGKKQVEIADLLGVHKSTVSRVLKTSKKDMRRRMEQALAEENIRKNPAMTPDYVAWLYLCAPNRHNRRLTQRQQQMLELQREGKTQGEIAAVLGISKTAVSHTLKAARDNLFRMEQQDRAATEIYKDDNSTGISGQAAAKALLSVLMPQYAHRLTPRQRQMLELQMDGKAQGEIATALKMSKAAVSLALKDMNHDIFRIVQQSGVAAEIRGEDASVDLSHPASAKAVLSVLTPKQAVFFYLYFAQRLRLWDIYQLTGRLPCGVHCVLRGALKNIAGLLGGQKAVLIHPEALDNLVYPIYLEMEAHPERLPERAPKVKTYRLPTEVPSKTNQPAIHVERPPKGRPPGKLLAALLERDWNTPGSGGEEPLFYQLIQVFQYATIQFARECGFL